MQNSSSVVFGDIHDALSVGIKKGILWWLQVRNLGHAFVQMIG